MPFILFKESSNAFLQWIWLMPINCAVELQSSAEKVGLIAALGNSDEVIGFILDIGIPCYTLIFVYI